MCRNEEQARKDAADRQAILATLALAFSGVALLSQWGMVLSLAVLLTVLVSLTVIPALLVLLGWWLRSGFR